ncbi:chlamydia polymorphic membrane middle domain protein, partial [Chlamydia psittaci 02DC14]
VKLLPSRLSI